MPVQTEFAEYALQVSKKIASMDGGGFEAKLFREGKCVAHVHDDGWGGPPLFDWLDADQPKVEAINLVQGKEHRFQATPEQARLYAFVRELKPAIFQGMALEYNPDFFISCLATETMGKKDWRAELSRKMKKKIMAIAADQSDVLIFSVAPNERNKQAVLERNPGCVLLNDLTLDEAFERTWPIVNEDPLDLQFKDGKGPTPPRRPRHSKP